MKSYSPPTATYRLQLHAGFTFKQLQEILDYLHDLGISTIYASPIFKATPGSQHGYDVTDPHQINPEIGTIEELRVIHQQLSERQMTWLQDIVPNHMAYHMTNWRLYDVLERGPLSPYYEYFDIDWQHPLFAGKVMAPFSGASVKLEAIPDGTSFPLSISAYDAMPFPVMEKLYQQATSGTSAAEWAARKRELLTPFADELKVPDHVIDQQYYQLTHWSDTDTKINYRRFFTVNELITLRMETPAVFEEYHIFVHSLYREGLIQGLRIDHIDGLRDPAAYIQQLRRLFGSSCYIIAEKILESDESFPSDWALQGTSGYEFLSYTNHLLSNNAGASQIRDFYLRLQPGDYNEIVYAKKRLILERYMAGEWENLVRYCYTLKLADARVNREKLKEAIALFMICLPVYRLYNFSPSDVVLETFEYARSKNISLETEMALLESFFEEPSGNRLLFLQRLMQFTGPLMAKGVEDTTFYVYNPLLSFNEVGDSPANTDFTLDTFHKRLLARQQHTPLSLNTTATHDTKRGEDGRIRLNMLTLMPALWEEHVGLWREMNDCPLTFNDEYFIYQSIVAGYFPDVTRLQEYFIKAVREAKVNSSWAAPVAEYEDAAVSFIARILSDPQFVASLREFMVAVDAYAYVSSLVQVLVKITSPGIPDIYQGCELWDYSYVDPDNRRPVDYALRRSMLAELQQRGTFVFDSSERAAGLEKMFVTWKALHCRASFAELFIEGDYIPLQSNVPLLAYARVHKKQWAVVIAPLPGETPSGTVLLPAGAPGRWRNVFTGVEFEANGVLTVAEVLKDFPVGLLVQ
jgi:(1->4)-alpha-D-glucan 1-alpha-D-glucosylmutase